MQTQAIMTWRESPALNAILHHSFVLLWKCTLFFDELEKYDKMSKAMRREDRRKEYND